ncbi:hypothetical protein E1B28_013055 [Marasmius oreades]|uniref:Transmembrane protein n=1 Tax=Marasmius oreades TaxID=181124 RepID=A0A9P7RQ68_9AGAR|nr:uncharacterized protein E1B28_013055 [Marasmius oreades]KAG7087073.1 hypothetical protein E1B28_013055 [Marasmius oreades]
MGATDTAAFAVPIAIVLMVAIVAVPCTYVRAMNKRRLRKRQQARKDRVWGSSVAIELSELERTADTVATNPNNHVQPPESAMTRTVRQPERDSLGLAIPPYSSADVQPLSPRELELVAQMSTMAERIRGLEERNRSRPPEYQKTSSPNSTEAEPQRGG